MRREGAGFSPPPPGGGGVGGGPPSPPPRHRLCCKSPQSPPEAGEGKETARLCSSSPPKPRWNSLPPPTVIRDRRLHLMLRCPLRAAFRRARRPVMMVRPRELRDRKVQR